MAKGMKQKLLRLRAVVDYLRDRNGASIRELAGELGVSEMTIRRDLEQLKLENIVSLVHGAAIFKADSGAAEQPGDYHLALEETVNRPEKERIGRAAAAMVQNGDIIIIDIGTTTEYLARYLPPGAAITVLCFTMNALAEVCKKKTENIIMGGGYYHANTQFFESEETISLVRRTRATKLFLSAAGVSRELGLTCANQYEVKVKQSCIESSLKKILLVDSGKFDRIRPAFVTSLDRVDTVITDNGVDRRWIRTMEDMGIEVRVV
jgi:DeoR family deoxyribose operon repressor